MRRRGLLAAAGLGWVLPAAPVLLALTDTDGFLSIPAAIDGTAVTLLLDTGADTGLITPEAAQALRLPVDRSRRTRMQGTGGEGAAVPEVVVASLALGDLRLSGLRVPVAPLPSFPRLSPPVAGLLGGDVLSVFDVAMDVPGGRLALWRPGARPARAEETVLAAERAGTVLTIPVALEDRPLRALLDTGARSLILGTRAAALLGVSAAALAAEPGGITSGVDLRPAEFHWHRFARLRIGPLLQRDVTLTVTPLAGAADMLLGAPFFAGRLVVLRYAAAAVALGGVGGQQP